MPSTEQIYCHTDSPLNNIVDDCLNRSAFIKQITQIILNLPENSCITIGIHGPWGYGKTSVMNFLCAEFESRDNIIVRKFNPWRLTDDESLFRGFVSLLAKAMDASLSTPLEIAKNKMGWFLKHFRWLAKLIGFIFPQANSLDALLSQLEKVSKDGKSCNLEELRSRITKHLKNAKTRTVVMIDDIDRLDKHETQKLFRLIKACADFPNICYVMFFDDTVVAKGLGEQFGGGDEAAGRAFLEKIIQLPLQLPPVAREDLRSLCFKHVDLALSSSNVELSREQVNDFITNFDIGASIRLQTPRVAKRYGNSLLFAFPMLVGEVNPVDLLLIESLRIFFPEIYCVVSNNQDDFSGVCDRLLRSSEKIPRAKLLLDSAFDGLNNDDRESVTSLLKSIFPRLAGIYGNMLYGQDSVLAWTKERRICAPAYCSRYFSYSISLADIPDSELATLVSSAADRDTMAVEEWLQFNLTNAKAKRVIEKLRSIETSISEMPAEIIALSLAKFGRLLPNPQSMFLFADPPSQAAILISHLLRRIADRTVRISVARQIVGVADPIWFAAECFRWFYVTDKPESQDKNTLSASEHADIRKTLVERIILYAKNGAPLFDIGCQQEDHLLYEWRRAEGREVVQNHLIRVFSSDTSQVAKFLQTQVPRTYTLGRALPNVGDLDQEQLKSIDSIIDVDVLADYVRRSCPGDFANPNFYHEDSTPLEQRLAEQFIVAYNQRQANSSQAKAEAN